MNWTWQKTVAVAVGAVMWVVIVFAVTTVVAAPDPVPTVAPVVRSDATADTLRALDRLRSYGYTINTPARAARAIRHWQQVNGLTVDGVVGRATLASLGLVPLPPAVAGSTAPGPQQASVPVAAPAGDIEALIRAMWPDDSEDRAVQIAWRESRHQPTASNACCHGLFQIHYRAHRAWLAGYGVNTPTDLHDPVTNITVALALYGDAGWGPWRL